jgi:hypothetical protein
MGIKISQQFRNGSIFSMIYVLMLASLSWSLVMIVWLRSSVKGIVVGLLNLLQVLLAHQIIMANI